MATYATAKAAYACEAVPLAGRQINALRTCSANSQVPGTARGRPPTLAIATNGKVEMDPLVLVPARRAMAMRRIIVKNPELRQEVAFILAAYRQAGHVAVAEGEHGLARRANCGAAQGRSGGGHVHLHVQ